MARSKKYNKRSQGGRSCIVYVYRFPVFTTPSLLHEEQPRRVSMYYQICQYYAGAHSAFEPFSLYGDFEPLLYSVLRC